MSETPKTLKHIDEESIQWQSCAICGQQKLRVIQQIGRPDFAFCDNCHSAYVLEDGGKMRMLYGSLPESMPKTRAFALKRWQTYFEIRAVAEQERTGKEPDLSFGMPSTQADLASLEIKKHDLLYSQGDKPEPPPRALRETGDLPNLDDLFQDPEDS